MTISTWYLLEGGDLTGKQWNASALLFARLDLKQITISNKQSSSSLSMISLNYHHNCHHHGHHHIQVQWSANELVLWILSVNIYNCNIIIITTYVTFVIDNVRTATFFKLVKNVGQIASQAT